jgi:hypothetical protein
MDCVSSHRSHSRVIKVFASFCFMPRGPFASPKRALVVALVFFGVRGCTACTGSHLPLVQGCVSQELHVAQGEPARCSQPISWLAVPRSLAAAAPIPHFIILTRTI